MSMPAEHLSTGMPLDELLDGFASPPSMRVTDICSDSRQVRRGSLFLAVDGASSHGIDFAAQAVEAGAAAILYDSSTVAATPDTGVPMIAVDDLRDRVGEIANRFFDFPSRALDVAGVTGTNGKTTVAWLIAQCLGRLGSRCAYSGTLGHGIDTLDADALMTTPDAIETHRRLAAFRDAGATGAAVEVSSHALDQRRIDGVEFDSALFTNLSRDHLDYHGSMSAYAEAKARLFLDYPVKRRIINLDTEAGTAIAARCGENVVTVSTKFDRVANGRPYVFARSIVSRPAGSTVALQTAWGDARLAVPLPGDFNVANALLVLAYLLARGVGLDDACEVIGDVDAPPGRMQRVVAEGDLPAVYVDYAHTPDALEVVLRALKPHCRGRLWCVFGCGGDRDAGKRPLMGRIAERLASEVVVTNDNPRNESPVRIFEEIVAGMRQPDRAHVIEDRATAIGFAVARAAAGDAVLVAGKGHESYQVIGAEQLAFSDYTVADRHLRRRAEQLR